MEWELLSPELRNLLAKYLAATFGLSTIDNTEAIYRSGLIRLVPSEGGYALQWKNPSEGYKTLGEISAAK